MDLEDEKLMKTYFGLILYSENMPISKIIIIFSYVELIFLPKRR